MISPDLRGPALRAALDALAPAARERAVDALLGGGDVPADEPALPRGCVPYLPCPIDAVLRALDLAAVGPGDVFVDVGAGQGRVVALAHLLTGARAVGVEVQPGLAAAARARAAALGLDAAAVDVVTGDVADHATVLATGTVFFLYRPFSGARLEAVLTTLAALAQTRTLHVCAIDLPLPPAAAAWLTALGPELGGLVVYRGGPAAFTSG